MCVTLIVLCVLLCVLCITHLKVVFRGEVGGWECVVKFDVLLCVLH